MGRAWVPRPQNTITDLWSLFDFLMPGFLGTRRHFHERFGRPILASRDPKCTSREQEAGALALEALQRQLHPFLLRRLKEEVLKDLPPKILQDFLCDLSPLQVPPAPPRRTARRPRPPTRPPPRPPPTWTADALARLTVRSNPRAVEHTQRYLYDDFGRRCAGTLNVGASAAQDVALAVAGAADPGASRGASADADTDGPLVLAKSEVRAWHRRKTAAGGTAPRTRRAFHQCRNGDVCGRGEGPAHSTPSRARSTCFGRCNTSACFAATHCWCLRQGSPNTTLSSREATCRHRCGTRAVQATAQGRHWACRGRRTSVSSDCGRCRLRPSSKRSGTASIRAAQTHVQKGAHVGVFGG